MFKNFTIGIIYVLISSCSFYSFKGSIPAHIKSVVISPIINNTSEYTVSTLLDEKFTTMMLLENVLDIGAGNVEIGQLLKENFDLNIFCIEQTNMLGIY